jgi:predicted transcriptional regulator
VRNLVEAVAAARQKQEADAAALMARAQEIAGRRSQINGLLQRMGALGQMAKEVQELLKSGKIDDVQARMDQVAQTAGEIGRDAAEQEMEDLARQADVLRQQVLAARNKVGLLARKGRGPEG